MSLITFPPNIFLFAFFNDFLHVHILTTYNPGMYDFIFFFQLTFNKDFS